MRLQSRSSLLVITLMAVLPSVLPSVSANAGEVAPVVPVVWESPGCDYDKLGSVEITLGQRVSETTMDPNVPTVDYGRAMARLAEAAQARGANAVVLRQHQGVYFTLKGKRSREPVYVKLSGGAIRLTPEAMAKCPLMPVSVADLRERSRSEKAVNATSREAFEGG